MRKALLPVLLFVLFAGGCRGDGSSILGGFGQLDSCDYAASCAQAIARASSAEDISPELGARLLALKMNALMKFPPVEEEFLSSIGIVQDAGYTNLLPILEKLAAGPEGKVFADQAAHVVEFMKEPVCTRFMELEAVQKGAGPFAASAAIARISSLIQVLSAVTPENSAWVAGAIRQVVGCSLSDRAEGGAVMLAARTMLGEAMAACPAGDSGDLVLRTVCEQGRRLLAEVSIPLPMVESRSGELAGALLPIGRSIGISFNPPWMIVLSAGRLMLVDQAVLTPDGMQVPQFQPQQLLDLRQPHRQEDIKTALHQALKTRKPWTRPGDDRSTYIFLVVDRSTTFADLAEVAGGFLAESESVPLVAVLPAGGSLALWQPLNFFISSRPLYTLDGRMGTFIDVRADGKPGPNAVFELTPFGIKAGGRAVEISRSGDGSSQSGPDLRDVNRLAAELVAGGAAHAATLKVSQAVTVEHLLSVMQSLSYRMPETAFASAGAYLSSQEVRKRLGEYDYLTAWLVLDRNW